MFKHHYFHRFLASTLCLLLLGMISISLRSLPVQAAERSSLDLSTAIIEVAKKNLPAVVYVEVTKSQEVVNPLLPFEKGVLIVGVTKGGPAERAGLKKNDVVIAYQGKEVTDSSVFRNEVAETPIGTEAKITVLRGGRKEVLTVKIESLEASTKVLAASVKERLGAEVRSPNSSERDKYGLNPNEGVVITWLDPKGPLKEAGFEGKDMILAIDNQPIESMEGFVNSVSVLEAKQKIAILALDHRTGNTGTIEIVTRQRIFQK